MASEETSDTVFIVNLGKIKLPDSTIDLIENDIRSLVMSHLVNLDFTGELVLKRNEDLAGIALPGGGGGGTPIGFFVDLN